MTIPIRLALGFTAAACVAAAGTASQASTPALKRNGLIAFVSNRLPDRGGEIFSVTAAGARRRDLSRSPSPDSDPVVSPDGRRVAFFSSRPKSGLYVANVDGIGAPPDRRHCAATRSRPAGSRWSRDGRSLAFAAAGNVLLVRASGGGLRRLGKGSSRPGPRTAHGSRSSSPAARGATWWSWCAANGRRLWSRPGTTPVWSPQGARLAYTSVGRVIRQHDHRRRGRIGVARFRGQFQSWSPDGKRLAFWRGDRYALYVAAANGRGTRRVSPGRTRRHGRPARTGSRSAAGSATATAPGSTTCAWDGPAGSSSVAARGSPGRRREAAFSFAPSNLVYAVRASRIRSAPCRPACGRIGDLVRVLGRAEAARSSTGRKIRSPASSSRSSPAAAPSGG